MLAFGVAVADGATDAFGVAPFLSPVTIKTSVVLVTAVFTVTVV